MTEIGDGPYLPEIGGQRSEHLRDVSAPTEPVPPPVQAQEVDLSQTDVLCRRCRFNLRGLTPERNCPECGFPIERTLQGDPLILSSPGYLRKLSIGLAWILVSTIVQIGLSLVGAAAGFVAAFLVASGGMTAFPYWSQIVMVIISIPLSLALLYGWWMFSTPDPDITSVTASDSGDSPRIIVRWMTVLLVVTSLLSGVSTVMRGDPTEVDFFVIGIGLLATLGSILQFFASLYYVRWIARRMQDASLVEKAARYVWMLPLIYIAGMCVIVGPLVALVLYVLLLNQLRKGINFMIAQQAVDNIKVQVA